MHTALPHAHPHFHARHPFILSSFVHHPSHPPPTFLRPSLQDRLMITPPLLHPPTYPSIHLPIHPLLYPSSIHPSIHPIRSISQKTSAAQRQGKARQGKAKRSKAKRPLPLHLQGRTHVRRGKKDVTSVPHVSPIIRRRAQTADRMAAYESLSV